MPDGFLTDDSNKTKLNDYLCNYFARSCPEMWGKEFCISNKLINVFTSDGQREILYPNPINIHDEADNRIVTHINDSIEKGYNSVLVRTGDSDVLVILLSFMEYFLTKQPSFIMHVEIKTSGKRRVFNLYQCYTSLGTHICNAFPFFHCFTGADSTNSFFKISKKVWFENWMKFPSLEELCSLFNQMSNCPVKSTITSNQEIIKQFVIFVYSPQSMHLFDIHELRIYMFERQSLKGKD